MNKKFSTLAASLLFASAFSTVVYSTGETTYRTQDVKSAQLNLVGTGWNSDYSVVKKIEAGKYYQLQVLAGETSQNSAGEFVLVQQRDYTTGKLSLKVMPILEAPLTASLWQVEVVNKTLGNFEYRFKNKETGYYLTYACADATVLGSEADITGAYSTIATEATDIIKSDISTWRWYVDDEDPAGLGDAKLWAYSHDEQKTVFGLVQNGQSEIAMVQIPYGKLTGNNMENFKIMSFTLRNAGAMALTADEINSMIDADGSYQLPTAVDGESAAFTGNIESDLTSGEYTALESKQTGIDNSYVSFNILLKKGDKYLKVEEDKTWEPNELPTLHGGLVVNDAAPTATLNTNIAINATDARYHWRVTYYPTPDSLVFEPLNASVIGKKDAQAGKKWADTDLKDAAIGAYYNTINAGTVHVDGAASSTTNVPFTGKVALEPVALIAMNQGDNDYDKVSRLSVGNPLNTTQSDSKVVRDNTSAQGTVQLAYPTADMRGLKISFDHTYTYLTRSTMESGLYFINLATTKPSMVRPDNAYLVDNMEGKLMYDVPAMDQEYNNMPATMWVVEQDTCNVGFNQTPTVKIYNREYGKEGKPVFAGQLYEAGEKTVDGQTVKVYTTINHRDYTNAVDSYGKFNEEKFRCADTIYFTPVTDTDALTSEYHGYNWLDEDVLNDAFENRYNMKYNHFENDNLFLNSSLDEISVVSEGANTIYEIAEATVPYNDGVAFNDFGYASTKANLKQLKRKAYVIKVKDANLIDNDWTYIALVKNTNGDNQYYYKAVKKSEIDGVNAKYAQFYLKADQVDGGKKAYVLVDVLDDAKQYYLENGWNKANVVDGLGHLRYADLNDNPADRASAFSFVSTTVNQYINIAEDYKVFLNSNVKVYQQLAKKNYLFEDEGDANNVAAIQPIDEDFHYLGIESKGLNKKSSMYVDEVVLDKELMQRYLFGVRVDSILDGWICDHETRIHGYWDNKQVAEDDGEVHFEEYNGYTAGWFMVNLEDSVAKYNSTNMMHEASKYKFNNYTRLGFVEGIHQLDGDNEYLYIVNAGYTLNDLMTVKNNGNAQAKYTKAGYVLDPKFLEIEAGKTANEWVTRHNIAGDINTNHTFSLRKVNEEAGEATASEPFLIESACESVAGFSGMWVKSHNGIPVLAKFETASNDHEDESSNIAEQIGQSGVFYFETTEEEATANEGIEATGVKVIATNGAVIVKGAEGKNVVITNVLGQQIANTVVSSNEATIAAPRGYVTVAVEGEAAVKAIVK